MKKFPLLVLASILILIIITGCAKQDFNGSRTSNDEQFIIDYTVLNKTITHEMSIKQGTIIDVIIENKSGSIDILVTAVDGEKIYKGDKADSGEFSFEIPETGVYKFSVTGSNAKGSVSFKVSAK